VVAQKAAEFLALSLPFEQSPETGAENASPQEGNDMTPALFVPGLLCTSALYEPQVEALGARLDIQVGDHTQHDSMAGIAAHLLSRAPERFVLAGLSMGGYVAFEIMRQASERVDALILLDTGPHADTPEQTKRRKELLALAQEEGVAPVIDALLPKFVAEEHLADAELTGTIRQMAHDTGVDAFSRQQKAIMERPDSVPTLGQIKCPTLVVVGGADALTPPALSETMAQGIAGAKLEVIHGSGHISTLERPADVNRALIAFLEGAGVI
jgi:pimeloyl-ACP methyl ester carboxylesterase